MTGRPGMVSDGSMSDHSERALRSECSAAPGGNGSPPPLRYEHLAKGTGSGN